MTGVEDGGQHDGQDAGDHTHQHCPQGGPRDRRAQRGVPDRYVGADDEHHQRESDVGQQCEGRVGRVDDTQPRSADEQSDSQLTDDHRDAHPGNRGEHRSGQPDDGDQGQGVEAEAAHALGAHDTSRQGIGVFSSVR